MLNDGFQFRLLQSQLLFCEFVFTLNGNSLLKIFQCSCWWTPIRNFWSLTFRWMGTMGSSHVTYFYHLEEVAISRITKHCSCRHLPTVASTDSNCGRVLLKLTVSAAAVASRKTGKNNFRCHIETLLKMKLIRFCRRYCSSLSGQRTKCSPTSRHNKATRLWQRFVL